MLKIYNHLCDMYNEGVGGYKRIIFPSPQFICELTVPKWVF